jgi:hypothetical protein
MVICFSHSGFYGWRQLWRTLGENQTAVSIIRLAISGAHRPHALLLTS